MSSSSISISLSRHTDTSVLIKVSMDLFSAVCDRGSHRKGSIWLFCIQVQCKVTAQHPRIQPFTVLPRCTTWYHQDSGENFFPLLCFSWVNFLYQVNAIIRKRKSECLLLSSSGIQSETLVYIGSTLELLELSTALFSCFLHNWEGHHSIWNYLSTSHILMHQEWFIYLIINLFLCSHSVLHIKKTHSKCNLFFPLIYTFKY